MHHHYADIRNRIPEPPRWWDEYAVPRWCDFAPGACADIYARKVALVEIACQACRARFPVAFSQSAFDFRRGQKVPSLVESVQAGTLYYGDPPNVGCCPAGPTMTSLSVRVLEFWECDRDTMWKWVRRGDLEIPLADASDPMVIDPATEPTP